MIHTIDCCICSKTNTMDGIGRHHAVEEFIKEGWDYGSSEVFGCEGVMCKRCLETPDNKRLIFKKGC